MQGPTGAPGESGEPVSNCRDLMRHARSCILERENNNHCCCIYRVQLVHLEEKVNQEKKEILEVQ